MSARLMILEKSISIGGLASMSLHMIGSFTCSGVLGLELLLVIRLLRFACGHLKCDSTFNYGAASGRHSECSLYTAHSHCNNPSSILRDRSF